MDEPIWNLKYQQEVVCLHHETKMFSCLFDSAMMVLLELPREEYASGFRGMLN